MNFVNSSLNYANILDKISAKCFLFDWIMIDSYSYFEKLSKSYSMLLYSQTASNINDLLDKYESIYRNFSSINEIFSRQVKIVLL